MDVLASFTMATLCDLQAHRRFCNVQRWTLFSAPGQRPKLQAPLSVCVLLLPLLLDLPLWAEMASAARLAVLAALLLPEPRAGLAITSAVHVGASGGC